VSSRRNDVPNEKRRVALLAAALFTASLAGGVILGLFGDALSEALGTWASTAIEYGVPVLVTFSICLGFAMRWPSDALRRTLVAFLVVQCVGLVLGVVLWRWLLPAEPFPLMLVVLDVASGAVCAGVGAMAGKRLAKG
jgi:hypothetical protein